MPEDQDFGCCDICGGTYYLGSDDHNGDTGNHYKCEELHEGGMF